MTALASLTNPSVFGQSVTLTATVSVIAPGAGTPTGTVTFSDGSTALGTASLSSGQATLAATASVINTVGTHTITAQYGGGTAFAVSSGTGAVTITKAGTTTSLSSMSPGTVAFGQSVNMTATVLINSPGSGTMTGTVSFRDNAAALGTSVLTGTSAGTQQVTFALSGGFLAAGSHPSLKAVYAGDGNFIGSTSTVKNLSVTQAATSTTVTSSANSSNVGSTLTFTATLANTSTSTDPASINYATGTVTFLDGGASIGTGLVTGHLGAATFTTSTLSIGTHTITASYPGDTNFQGSTGTLTGGQTVSQASTTTTVTGSSNPSVFGQSVMFTATVSPQYSGAPTGTVTFSDGSTSLGTTSLSGSTPATATYTTSILAASTHTITASYSGDTNFTTSGGSILQTVSQASTSTSVISSTTASVFGQSVTFTATVSPQFSGTFDNGGTVTFSDSSTLLGTTSLSGSAPATATYTTSILAAATHTITASYSGDTNFTGSSNSVLQTVNTASTSTSVTSSTTASVFGQSVTFTATVSPQFSGTFDNGGTVTFSDGSTLLGTTSLSGSAPATATYTTSILAAATHTITASYSGDSNFTDSMSGDFLQTVNPASTTTALASSTNPSVYGQSVTFTATVSVVSPVAGTPIGVVTFEDNGFSIGTGSLTGGTTATFTTSLLSVATHTLTANYSGVSDFLGSTGLLPIQTVGRASTTTTVTSTPNPSGPSQPMIFTVTVTAASPGAGTPTGTVTFVGDGTPLSGLSTVALNNGRATFTPRDTFFVGSHSITVIYGGDINFTGNTSASLSQLVKQTTITTAFPSVGTSIFGQSIAFTAIVGGSAYITPGGTVSFLDGSTALGTSRRTVTGQQPTRRTAWLPASTWSGLFLAAMSIPSAALRHPCC